MCNLLMGNVTKKRDSLAIVFKILFICMFVFVLAFFLTGELFMPKEDPTGGGTCTEYDGDWERVLPDGEREHVRLPGTCEAKRGETVRLETVLSDTQPDTWFCMRASQQDMRVYVGEELRQEYSTKDTRLFGRNSASAFVFFKVTDADAGKTLAIELISDSEYSVFLNKVYTGEKNDIVNMLIRQCIVVICCSLYMLILSSMVVAVSCMLHWIYKRKVDVIYLGVGLMIVSVSMIAESNVRQFFLPNASIAAHVGFLLTILIPFPFMVYVSRLQRDRYQSVYKVLSGAVFLNFILSVVLWVTETVDLVDSMAVAYAIIILMLFFFVVTICMDIRKKRIAEYGEVLIGIVVMCVVAVWETCITFIPTIPFNGGVALGLGLIFLLITAAIKAAREMVFIEKEKQMAVAASQAKAVFLANMSHEIRTPINTIIGMNEMILRDNQDETVQEYANNVSSASRLLLGLVNDVLDFSKIESGKMDIADEEYYLSKVLTDVVNGTRIKTDNKNLAFVVDVDPALPSKLIGDELRIRQILNNLLSNAVKYTEKGTITLYVRGLKDRDGFTLHMSVEDTGMGIRKEDIARLFDSFRRLEEKRNHFIEGTGLGLNITKQLVELMGGDISVTSEYTKGSSFTVNIPQKIADDMPIGKLSDAYQRDTADKKETKNALYAPTAEILVVDDNKMNLVVVSALLKRTAIKLTLAGSGTECLEYCMKKRFDLILMDHMMPDPDGIATLHMIRTERNSLNRNTHVIVLTANAIAGMSKMYMQEGFSGYLTKPIIADDLEKMIEGFLPKNKIVTTMDDNETGIFHIDKKTGIEYCGNDAGIYQEMLVEYRAQGQEYLIKLKEYYDTRDWKNYRTIIHALKNTSLLIGAVTFSEKAKRLELAASEANEEILLNECETFLEEYRTILKKVE